MILSHHTAFLPNLMLTQFQYTYWYTIQSKAPYLIRYLLFPIDAKSRQKGLEKTLPAPKFFLLFRLCNHFSFVWICYTCFITHRNSTYILAFKPQITTVKMFMKTASRCGVEKCLLGSISSIYLSIP